MNTFRKGGLFTDMKMNTTANFHKMNVELLIIHEQ